MADSLIRYAVSKPTATDLSALQFHPVVLNSAGNVEAVDATGDIPFGILQNKPTTGEAASVVPIGGGGSSKIKLGAVLAIGALAGMSSTGTAVAAAGARYTLGVIETGGNTSDIGKILLNNLIIKA